MKWVIGGFVGWLIVSLLMWPYLQRVVGGLCDDSPTGVHCSCWIERAQACCHCQFTDGPHNLR